MISEFMLGFALGAAVATVALAVMFEVAARKVLSGPAFPEKR